MILSSLEELGKELLGCVLSSSMHVSLSVIFLQVAVVANILAVDTVSQCRKRIND